MSGTGLQSAVQADVLISNAWGRTPYNVTRSLARQQLRVIVGADAYGGMAALSRYSTATFRHPNAISKPERFVECIKDAIETFSPRVYLPMGEDTYIVARHLDELQSSAVRIPVAPYQTIRRLHRKDEVIELARCLGIPVPETIVPESADEVRAFCRQNGSPVVLKRISSSSARGVFYLTPDELPAAPLKEFVVQRYVQGTGYGVSMLFNHGKLRAKFTHKRLKEMPTTGGISTLRVGVVHPVLEEYAQRLLESVNFHGVAMVEFKHNEQTGESWLIEVNPRFWGSLALAIQSGVDFPHLLFRMATEGDIDPVGDYRTGVAVKWILGDLATAIRQSKRSPESLAGGSVKADGYDDLYWDDPLAFLGGSVLALWKHLATRGRKHDQVNLSIEWMGTPEKVSNE